MIQIKRSDSENNDFRSLVKQLDAVLKLLDGDEHTFYDQFNKIDKIKFALVAYENNEPSGCGAIKEYSSDTMEVKRMFVKPDKRGKGIASVILKGLENWCLELKFNKCILETGRKQPEAIRLYEKNGYKLIPNYGQYENKENSLCFEKIITD